MRFIIPLLIVSTAFAAEPKQYFNGKDFEGWVFKDEKKAACWKVAGAVEVDKKKPAKLVSKEGRGLLIADPIPERDTNLMTKEQFGDCAVKVEFLVPKDGNSGLFLLGRYELQICDSHGIADKDMTEGDAGGVPFTKKPLTNASLAPGEWQTMEVHFMAPRFDGSGKKTANAKIVKAILNGKVVQENFEYTETIGGAIDDKEAATGPLMIQGDHTPVAYRSVLVEKK